MRGIELATIRRRLRSLPRRLHRDERGVMSLVTVFVVLAFTMLAAMLLNVARHVDDRLRLQNAADAGTYSGAVTMARGMNTLAFSNHLLCEVFALTAYMREGAARHAESHVPAILDEWAVMGQLMEQAANDAGIEKLSRLGRAIPQKVPHEAAMVEAFGEMTAAQADMTLGALEYVLQGETADLDGGFIPDFQRAVVRTTPALAQLNADEVARRYAGEWADDHGGRPITATMYRAHTTHAFELASNDETAPLTRTLPAVDPCLFGTDRPDASNPDGSDYYIRTAREQRRGLATHYLDTWINDWMGPYFGFDPSDRPGRETAKMSNLINLWRTTTCARLDMLLEDEYRYANVPHVYRREWGSTSQDDLLLRDQTWVGVAHWNHMPEEEVFAPGVFRNRLDEDGVDASAFAQATIFIPRNRYARCGRYGCGWGWWTYPRNAPPQFHPYREGRPQGWSLLNQGWTAQLVPTTAPAVPAALSARPSNNPLFRPPPLGDASTDELGRINFH